MWHYNFSVPKLFGPDRVVIVVTTLNYMVVPDFSNKKWLPPSTSIPTILSYSVHVSLSVLSAENICFKLGGNCGNNVTLNAPI